LNRYCTHHRLIAAILMVFVLGVQFVNALSNSHTQFAHRHGGSEHAGKAHTNRGHDQLIMKSKGVRTHAHAHKHDPSDHSHDFPLRLVLAAYQLTFMPIWHTEAAFPFRSVVVHPLERPPKSTAVAPLA
jgi:hypothetical protein